MANKLNIYNSSAIYDSMVKDGFLKADKLSKEKFLTALEYNPKYMPRVRSYVQRVYGMSPEDFDNLVYTPDYSQDVSDLPPSGSSDYVPSMPWDNTPAQFSLPYKTKPGSDNNLPGLPAHDNTSQPNFMRDFSPENVTRRALSNAKPQPMQYIPKEEWDKEIRKKEAIQQGLQEIAAHSTRSTTDYSQPITVKSVTHPSDLTLGEWYNSFASDTYSIQKEAGRIYQMWQVGAIDEDEARSRFHQLYVSPQTAQSRSFARTIDERRNFRRNNAAIDAAEAEITKKLQAAAAQKPTQPIPMPYMGDARISDSIDEQYYKQSLRFLDDARKISRAYADNNYNGTSTAQRVLRGIGDNLITPEAITMGFSAIADNANLMRILEKDERGEQLSDAEETLLSAAIIKQYTEAAYASGAGIAYNIGAVTGESLPYMLSFVVTGIPIKAATSGLSKRIVNFVGRQLQRKGIGRAATRATKAALGLGGNIATSALQAPIMPSTYSDYLDRRIGTIDSTTDGMGNISFSHQGDSRSEAALKAYFNTFYQNFGERSGEAISSLWGMFGRGIGKIPIGRGKSINDIFDTIHNSRLGKFWDVMQGTAVADFMRQANYDGVFAEVVEEYISGILNAATIGDQSFEELFSQDNLLTTMGGIALTSVMLGSANATLGVAATQRIRTNFNRSSKAAQQYFSPEQLNQLIGISGGSVQDITTFLAANIARRQLIARQISQLADRRRNGETGIEAQINTLGAELQDLRMQYDFVNASAMYNAYIGGLSRRIEPMREQARAAIRANGDPATGLTIQVNVNGRQGYLIGGNYNHIQDADGNISVTPTGDLATVLFDGDKTPTPNIPMETISILGVRRTDDVIRDGDRAIFAATEQEENAAQAPATGSTVTVSGSQGNFILQGYDPQGNAIVTPLNTDGTPAVKNGNPITASVPSENIIPEEAGNTSSSIRTGSIAYIDGIPYSVDQVDGENAIIHRLNTDGTPVNDEQGNPITSIVPTATLSSSPHPAQTVEPQNVPDEQQPIPEQQAAGQAAAIEETNTQQQPAIVDDNITETPSSALSRIPIDKNGKSIYEQSDPETAYDAILQQADGDTALASRVILSMIDNKEAALNKLSKAKPRRADNPADIIKAEKELAAQIKQAESDLQFWKDTALVPSLRNQAQKEAEANSVIQDPSLANTPDSRTRDNDGSGNHQGIGAIQADVASTQENSEERLTHEEALAIISDMEKHAEVAPEIELTPENWVKEFGNDGIVNTPIGEVKQGDNQYLKLAQQGRNSKLGMVRPTLERPSIIILDERPAREGKSDRDTSFVFIKTFIKEDGTRYYYFTSVTVSKEGKEVVISSQERSANRISKLLQQGKIAWIDTAFSLHPTTQVEGSVPLNDSNTPTVTDNQPALLGINSSELSQNKDNEKSPISSDLGEKVADAEAETDINPTDGQKEAGNYKKGHVQIGQFDVSIEQPKGSVRSGVDASGNKWETTMQNTYGYIRGTEGVDGDHIDVFLANDIDGWNGSRVFVIDQYNEDGTFDEHKVMIGFNDEADAQDAYLSNYEKGWENKRKLVMTSVNLPDFENWINSSHRKTKPFAEYQSVNGEQKSVTPADRIKEINARLSELKERAAEARRSNDIISEARIITESNNLNAELRSLEAETKQRSISKRNLERSKLPLTEKEYANKRSEEIRKSNPDIDEIDAYNQAIDEYPSYILDKIRNGELEKIYEQASINDRIKLGRMVESAGYSVSDISSLANKKRQDEKNQNVHNIGERVTIRFYDGTIIKGDIISTGNGSVTVLNEEDKRKYTVPESRILSHQTNKEEIPNSNTPTKQARNLPGMLKEAYRQGNASDIAKSEADLRAYIESQSDLKAVAVTYFHSEDNMRQYKDKNSPEYRMNKFIADACKNALLKAGIAKEALMGERKRVAFASTTDDARTLDVMSIDPSYDVLRAVIRNPHTSDSVLRDFTERFQNNGLDYEAQQVLDERLNKKENSVRDNTTDTGTTVTGKQNDTATLQNTVSDNKDSDSPSKKQTDTTNTQTKKKAEDPKEYIPKAEKIEDVGEKIGGARKDIIHELTEKARKADSDKSSILDSIRSMPVSKIFNFDYERLRKDGVSNELITLLQVIREIIPSKPRSEYKLRRWTEQVFELYYASLKLITLHDAEQRAFFDKILGINQIDKIYQARMALGGFDSGLNTGKATLEELGENAGHYDKEGNWVSLKGHWYVKNAGKNGGIFPSRKEAEDALRTFAGENASPENSEKKTQFSVYRRNVDGTAFITVKGKPSIIVADGFKNSKEALDYLKTNYADLDAKYRSMKEKTNIAFRENRPRKGRDWRNGKNISAEEFRETFGFRGVEFGNWTNQEDRQQALNNAFDAFMDLADAIGKSPRSLSLNGQLGIAFGARGGGRAAAHYEPDKVVINLTKTQGAGSLAHEWWHAIDNYFARRRGQQHVYNSDRTGYKYNTEKKGAYSENERQELTDAFKELMNAINNSSYGKRSRAYASMKSSYWSRPTELGARAFAIWIERKLSERGTVNDFLANNPTSTDWGNPDMVTKYYPYPIEGDFDTLDTAFDNLFNAIQEEVDATTGNTILFHHGDVIGSMTAEQRAAFDAVMSMLKEAGVPVEVLSYEQMRQLADMNGAATRKGTKKTPETDSAPLAEKYQHTAISSADGSKVLKNLETLAENYENSVQTKEKTFIGEVADALNIERTGASSRYATFETKNGQIVTIRLSNHNATVSNFDNASEQEGISIVVSPKKNTGINNDGNAHVVEFYYDAIKLRKADGKPLAQIVRSIQQALYSGEYRDTTGLAVQEEVNGLRARLMTVYHGSGATFEQFDHSHIGEGEGVQAYGWGSYVTEVEDIGRAYAEDLGNKDRYMDAIDEMIEQLRYEPMLDINHRSTLNDIKSQVDTLEEEQKRNPDYDFEIPRLKRLIDELQKMIISIGSSRNLYTVEIPDDTGKNYLWWEKTLRQKVLRDIARKLEADYGDAIWVPEHLRNMPLESKMRYWMKETYPGNEKTGEAFYNCLSVILGSDRAASEFLSSAGFTGISYPAQYTSGGREDNARNYVIFNEENLKITDHVQFLKDRKGVIYGAAVGGKIYLNASALNPETPIHEYTHLWDEACSRANPELWQRGVELMKQTQLWNEVKNDPNYANLLSNDEIASEVHARLTGRDGAKLLERMVNEDKENGVIAAANAVSLRERLKKWLSDFWYWLKDSMTPWSREQASKISLSDFVNIPLTDLIKRTNILFREIPDQSTTQEQTNDRFNNELQQQIDGTLPKGHIYDLGMPSDTLLNAGLPNLPIEMAASRLSDKSMQENHPFDLSEIRNLPKAIQSPMAIFRSATRLGSFVVMTEIEHHGRNFVVAIQANRRKGRIEVNDIRSVYPKNNNQIANWVTEGLLEYADKKRMVEWLSKQRSNSAEVRKLFNHATNIIQNFDNPKNNNENIRLREMAAEVADAARPAQVTRQIERLAREMNLPIEIIHSIDDIPDEYTRRYIQGEIDGQPHTIVGYYDRTTGKAYIILPAILQTADPFAEAERTILHEVIAHHGMQALMGRDAYDTLCDEVWNSLPYETRARFAAYVLRKNPRDLTITDIARVAASPALRRAAADEYIAALAEGGVENPTLWQRIKAFFRSILRRMHLYSISPTDADIRYLLSQARENLAQTSTESVHRGTDIRFRELSAPEETIDNASRQGNDYARDARTHAAASIDTHNPDLSPVEQAEAVRFRELLTRDFSAASDFLNSANLINAAMQANDGKAAWLNNIQEAVFDSMLRLRLLLDRMKKDGASIPAGFNPYLAENQSRSRAQNRIAAFNEDYRRPLIESLAKCINKLREGNIGVEIKDNNAAHEALSLYAQARAAVERQEVKEREAREQAKADGTEYKHREWAGLPGIQYAIIALYKGEITDDVEANKNNLQWLQDFATENNIPTVEQYITMVENALQKENIDNLWENIRRISEFQLTTSRDAGILSRGSYQLLTYGYNIDEIIETLYKEQRKKITDDINNGIGDKDSLAADLADLDRRHLEAVATATDLDAPDAITTLVAGGWITQDIANDIHRYYNYYLPLKGHAEITGEDLFDYNTPSMPRNASRIKSVRGHEQLARDPFNQILRDAEGCIMQAERNRWKQQLYHVLSTNRSLANGQYAIQRKYYQVIKLDDGTVRYEPYQRVVTTENNEDITTFVPTAEEIAAGTAVLLNSSAEFDIYVSQKQRSEHETIVYIDGSPISILFYDARIAKAVNGTNEAYPPQWMPRAIIKASRTIPALLTSWHPEFVLLSNPIRDTQEAIANAAIDKGFKYTALLARNLATVDRDLWAYTGGNLKQKKDNGQPLSQYEKYVIEFFENGGSVNVTQLSDYETTTKDLKKELKRALKGGTKPSKNFWKRLTEQTELRSRIATYITSRQTGSTIQDAINDAKGITVNFDRRGAQFRNFNLLQMFFNAQMQSVRRQTELMRRHPVRYATTVAILASSKVLIGLGISLLLGGGDDDNTTAEDIIRRYFEINKQLRTRNHIFIIDGEVYRIPVAPAFIPFTTLCEEAAQLAFDPSSRHRNTASQALLSVTSSVLETYVPTLISDPANIMININNEQAWRQSFASGIPMSGRALWQPFIEAIYNYDYTGNPIYTEPQFGAQHLPFHRDYRERTGKAYVYTSKLLSDLTGGNNIIPGKINIHPEQIEHVVQGLAGGIGTLAGRFTGIYKRVQGESAESTGLEFLYDIPFAARLYGGNMQQRENRYYQSLFFDDKQALEAFRAQQRYIESSKDMQDFNKEYNSETRKYFYDFATADKLATKVRKWRDAHQKESPEYKQYEAILQDIYRTTDDAFNRLQQSNDNEPYEIIDNPYYIYNNIESQLDKELYNVNGTFMTIDDAARAWAARTRRDKKQYYTLSGDLRQIAKIRDEVKEIKKLFKEIGSDYYPGMPLNGRQQYIYRRIEQKTKALSSLYDEIALDNIQLIE